jgi:pimeloyl-ACP methyl ester carboxylesterase
MPAVEVNGCRINYIQIDCEAGNNCQDLVMIHGLSTNLAFWYLPHALQFSKHFRITLYDLRGHGRSGVSDVGYTPSNMGRDLQALLDSLDIERAHFIAHSFGGVVALSLACLDPSRLASLVLADTHISAVRRLPKTKDWAFGKKIQQILNQYGLDVDVREPYFGYKLLSAIAHLHRQDVDIFPVLENVVGPVIGKFSKRTAIQWLNLLETTRAAQELMGDDGLSLDSLRKLSFPIRAMYGEHSQAMSTGEQLLEVWPHADFRRMRDAGHFFPLTRPSEFMENCRQFWNGAPIKKLSRRAGEFGRSFFRSKRFYSREGKWFFDTRESTEEGPFNSLNEAKEYLWSIIPSVYMCETN